MKTQTTLLFSFTHTYIGELTTSDGAFVRCLLSDAGERLLGHTIQEWRLQGIDRTFLREKGFLSAFLRWAGDHGVETAKLPDYAIGCWEKMIRLPFEPSERFRLIHGLNTLDKRESAQWFSAFDHIEKVGQETK